MNYLIVVWVVGLLILLHELGHFLAARWVKIPIARFSIGLGPKLWGVKGRKTEYQLSWIPIGGYVLPETGEEIEFFQIPVGKRILFAIGGPLANIILPLFLFGILNVMASGFSFTGVLIKPVLQTLGTLYQFVTAIPLLFSRPDQLSGIVGIVVQGGQFVGTDAIKVLNFSIVLSLNLAIINLLPIPPLDGGKICLYLVEKLHPKLLRLHVPLAIAGWLFILGLMVYATVLDIGRFIA
jgi:regulator of sigma E protease